MKFWCWPEGCWIAVDGVVVSVVISGKVDPIYRLRPWLTAGVEFTLGKAGDAMPATVASGGA